MEYNSFWETIGRYGIHISTKTLKTCKNFGERYNIWNAPNTNLQNKTTGLQINKKPISY